MIGTMTFRFLNETRRIEDRSCNIDPPSQLWLYNLHYFDDLNASDAEARRDWHIEAIAAWVQDNPPAVGVGWAPYPTSLRIVNWIKWVLNGAVLDSSARNSLAMQARVLSKRLEYHLLGNHLFSNAKALVFAGLFFEGREAEGWLEKGMSILYREIPEQILPDGGQFERSPMYHSLALEDVLDLINICRVFSDGVLPKWQSFVDSWPALAQSMGDWLSAMCHPDGEIAFFNDAATGIAPPPAELARYAEKLISTAGTPLTDSARAGRIESAPVRVRHLSESGYVRADASEAALLLDVAPIGPDYLPGHAHADTLSLELSLFRQRVIVNCGTSRYGLGPERDAERGTMAHSTVTVNDENSSEVWAGFRVARRARPMNLRVVQDPDSLEVWCAHDGYKRLAGQPIHRRRWAFQAGLLRVEDRIEGRFKSAVARFHLHPDVACEVEASGFAGIMRLPGGQIVRWVARGGEVRVERSTHCPEFGRRESAQCIAVVFDGTAHTSLELRW